MVRFGGKNFPFAVDYALFMDPFSGIKLAVIVHKQSSTSFCT